jgi:hypothetical protein
VGRRVTDNADLFSREEVGELYFSVNSKPFCSVKTVRLTREQKQQTTRRRYEGPRQQRDTIRFDLLAGSLWSCRFRSSRLGYQCLLRHRDLASGRILTLQSDCRFDSYRVSRGGLAGPG